MGFFDKVDPPGAGIYYVGYGKTTETFNFGNSLEKLEDEEDDFNPVNGKGKQKLKQESIKCTFS